MKRKEMIEHIKEDLLEKLNHYKFNQGSEVWADFVAKEMLDMIEGFGMKPPCVDGDKCQYLLSRYIDPSFLYWEEDFDKQHGEDFKELMERRSNFKGFKDLK